MSSNKREVFTAEWYLARCEEGCCEVDEVKDQNVKRNLIKRCLKKRFGRKQTDDRLCAILKNTCKLD